MFITCTPPSRKHYLHSVCPLRSFLRISSFPPKETDVPIIAPSVSRMPQERQQGLNSPQPGYFWGQFHFRGAKLKLDKISRHVKETKTQAREGPQKSLAHEHTQVFLFICSLCAIRFWMNFYLILLKVRRECHRKMGLGYL